MASANAAKASTQALRKLQRRAPRAVKGAAVAMGLLMTKEVTTNELIRYSHPLGTPTTSPAGEPPATVTGALRKSVKPQPPVALGYRASVTVGGTVVYARIQELGGRAGRNHASVLPPRPYLKPATQRITESGAASNVACAAFARLTMGA